VKNDGPGGGDGGTRNPVVIPKLDLGGGGDGQTRGVATPLPTPSPAPTFGGGEPIGDSGTKGLPKLDLPNNNNGGGGIPKLDKDFASPKSDKGDARPSGGDDVRPGSTGGMPNLDPPTGSGTKGAPALPKLDLDVPSGGNGGNAPKIDLNLENVGKNPGNDAITPKLDLPVEGPGAPELPKVDFDLGKGPKLDDGAKGARPGGDKDVPNSPDAASGDTKGAKDAIPTPKEVGIDPADVTVDKDGKPVIDVEKLGKKVRERNRDRKDRPERRDNAADGKDGKRDDNPKAKD
jgi:hypothetical protein